MLITIHLVPITLLAAFALLAPERAAAGLPSDFTLGPGGKIAIGVDQDSTTAGCLSTDTSQCDSYAMKIPFQMDTAGDLVSDLSIGNEFLTLVIFATTGQPCTGQTFEASFTVDKLTLKKTKSSESAKFSGMAFGGGVHGVVMVPISFKLKASRKTGKGTMIVKGLGQGLGALSGATVDVRLEVGDVGNDSDVDAACATVPAAVKNSP
jgi:hypothetical protein